MFNLLEWPYNTCLTLTKLDPDPLRIKVSADNFAIRYFRGFAYTVELSLFIFMRATHGCAL